jgi:hypothetical protein
MNAVEKLNTGKSADENGIQAEHFRNAKEELAPLLEWFLLLWWAMLSTIAI